MGRPRPSQAVRSRAARLVGLAAVGASLTLAAGYLLLPVATRIMLAALSETVNAAIWLVAAGSSGQDRPAIVAAIGRALLRALTSPWALGVFSALAAIGAAALYALRRLLDLEEKESSR